MRSSESLFGNQFDDPKITNLRLLNFTEECLNRIKAVAIEDQYSTTIAELTSAVNDMKADLGGVDSSLNLQKNKTLNISNFMDSFKSTMSSIEGPIAYKSGRESALYMQLYPNGKSEYSKLTKKIMPVLMERISGVATSGATELGEEIAGQLSGLKTQWQTLLNAQEQQMSKVGSFRNERTAAREKMELALHNAWHTMAIEFPYNVQKCEQFFRFHMLLPVKHATQKEEVGEETEG